MTQLLHKLALTAAAAVGLYVSTLGLPLPVSCAAPSPSCGGDLRECLRQSADMRQTTFGGRYVTAEDVARCMEAFNASIHSVTGMKTEHVESDGADCATTSEGSGPFTYDFTTNGTVSVHEGPIRWQTTHCTGSNSSTEPVRNLTGTWSVTT